VPDMEIDEQIRARLNQKLYRAAFDLIAAHYSDKVLRLSYSILGNLGLAEDVVQDVLVRVWRALPAYRGDAAVSTWIYTITRNTCFTALKGHRKGSSVSLDEPVIRLEAERVPSSSQQSDLASDLLSLLSILPDKHRQVMMLFYLEDKSHEEVARMLDIPIGTVKTYLYRGRQAIASLLRQKQRGDFS
jgi:RNA polymerase sigma-70 factor, ECF subfamily